MGYTLWGDIHTAWQEHETILNLSPANTEEIIHEKCIRLYISNLQEIKKIYPQAYNISHTLVGLPQQVNTWGQVRRDTILQMTVLN